MSNYNYITTRIQNAKVTRLVLICGLLSTQACVMAVDNPFEDGTHLAWGDEAGIKAYSDMHQGLITNGKASPDQDTAHYQLRKEQTRVDALRFTSRNLKGGK